VVLGLGGGGGGGGALVSTVVGAIADGAAEGALVTGGGIGAALDGGGGGAVGVVTGTVGSTTPVSPNGCRDTTVIADTTTQTATTPSTPTVTALGQAVQDQRSRDGAYAEAVPSCSSRTHSTACVSCAMSK
jgi:hypothetical protein